MESDTEDLLRTSLTHLLSTDHTTRLGPRLAELGWDEVVADDAAGAVRLLFEARATTLSPVDALTPVLSRLIATQTGVAEAASAAIALPLSLNPSQLTSSSNGTTAEVDGVCPSPPAGGPLLVPALGPDGPTLLLLSPGAVNGLDVTPLAGMDPSVGDRIKGTAAGSQDLGSPAWDEAVTTGRWAVATELVTLALSVLDDAVQYAGARHQYGRPIGTFQALQQRLAAAHASAVGAAHVVREASESGRSWDALVAKALAGRAAESACTQAQQCFGAIGFTWEHHLPHRIRRMYLLDRLFGDWRSLEAEIGTTLLQTREVPRVGAL
ncbi:MAG: hypothetical protein KGQ66_12230 [Acidobacteriota bacterium]|nr:hypothetical protein [Acidobacteriota bacterium]